MKKLLLLFIILMPFMANAQENVQGIIVELKNGDKVEFKLSENPKFTFDGAKVHIFSGIT